jgi:hypothetical protein
MPQCPHRLSTFSGGRFSPPSWDYLFHSPWEKSRFLPLYDSYRGPSTEARGGASKRGNHRYFRPRRQRRIRRPPPPPPILRSRRPSHSRSLMTSWTILPPRRRSPASPQPPRDVDKNHRRRRRSSTANAAVHLFYTSPPTLLSNPFLVSIVKSCKEGGGEAEYYLGWNKGQDKGPPNHGPTFMPGSERRLAPVP